MLTEERDDVVLWWAFGVVTDRCTDITAAMDAARPRGWGPDRFHFVVPIDDCGVILLLRHRAADPPV